MILFTTSRCLLRVLRVTDVDDVYRLNSHTEVIRYTCEKPYKNIKTAQVFINQMIHLQFLMKYSLWAIECKKSKQFVGMSGFLFGQDTQKPTLHYRLFPEFWSQGIGKEVVKSTIEYGLNSLKLSSISALALAENEASIRILNGIGMEKCSSTLIDKQTAHYFVFEAK